MARRSALQRSTVGLLVTTAVLLAQTGGAGAQTAVPTPAWSGDFSTGDVSQWLNVHAARPDAVTVQSATTRPGYPYAARFEVRPGDLWRSVDTERAELSTSKDMSRVVEGAEQYYAWSMSFAPGTRTQAGGWQSFTQWHQDADTCPPNVAFLITEGASPRIRLALRGGSFNPTTCVPGWTRSFDLGPLPTGTWTDVRLRALWSADPAVGRMEVRFGDQVVLPWTPVANLYTGQGAYLKQGLYRSRMSHTSVMHLTGTVRGSSAESVALRTAPPVEAAPAEPATEPTAQPTAPPAPSAGPTGPTGEGAAPAPPPSVGAAVSLGAARSCQRALRGSPAQEDAVVAYLGASVPSRPAPTGVEVGVVDGLVQAVGAELLSLPAGASVLSGTGTAAAWLRTAVPGVTRVDVASADDVAAVVCLVSG